MSRFYFIAPAYPTEAQLDDAMSELAEFLSRGFELADASDRMGISRGSGGAFPPVVRADGGAGRMIFRQRRFGSSYTPGRIDGPKARRRAQEVLLNAKQLDHLTIETLARTCGLTTATAAKMIADAWAERRGR